MKVNDVNTYFSVLGLTPTATRDDVRKQYLTLSKLCHPDKCTDPGAIDRKTKEFQKLREAYDELQNILGADDDDVFAEPGSEEMSNEDNEPGADDDIEEKFRVLKEKCEILQKRTAEIIELGVDIKVEAQEEMEVEVVEEMDEDTDPPPPADVAPPTDKKMEEQSVEEAGGPEQFPDHFCPKCKRFFKNGKRGVAGHRNHKNSKCKDDGRSRMPRKASLRSEVSTLMKTIAELIEREKSTMEEMAARKIQLDRLQDRQNYLEAELDKFKKP